MGVIRFLLGMAVVFAHMGPLYGFSMMGGATAVEMFFVISGFYTALIIHEKYPDSKDGRLLYYGNRFLRIFPSYWLVLLFSVAVGVLEITVGGIFHTFGAVREWVEHASSLPLLALLYLAISNVFLFGLDWSGFMTVDTSGLAFNSNALALSKGRIDFFSPVPQAWALGLECSIYAVAPFLFRAKTVYILAIMAFSLVLRSVGLHFGANFDPWTYRFFPFEIFFFLLGLISYRVSKRFDVAQLRSFALPAFLLLCGSAIFFRWMPDILPSVLGFSPRAIQEFALLALLMPFVFAGTKSLKFDKLLGDLSFPMYLVHVTFIPIIGIDSDAQKLMVLLSTLAASAVILRLVEIPIDRIRQGRLKRTT